MHLFIILFTFLCFSLPAQGPASYKLFAGSGNEELAQKVADYLGISVSQASFSHFSDGEVRIKIDENVRNCHTFVIHSTCANDHNTINDTVVELYSRLNFG